MKIGKRSVGSGASCYVIAEAGVNHNGDVSRALALIDAASEAGADAVKFQTFQPELLASASADKAAYQKRATGADESQLDMLRHLALHESDFIELKRHCDTRDIAFLSTPFEAQSADLLERIGVPAYKLPSGEITNLPFLKHVARKGRPVILSTGMSTLPEVVKAVDAVTLTGNDQLVVLHCVSAYPAEPSDCNLRAMATIASAVPFPVGFSDHTMGIAVPVAAAALGAVMIEKHLTLDRALPGPDHKASLLPDEFAEMIDGIRAAQSALGDGEKRRRPSEEDTARIARKSLVAARDLAAGAQIEIGAIAVLRPGTGIAPEFLDAIQGRRLARAVAAGTPLMWDDLT